MLTMNSLQRGYYTYPTVRPVTWQRITAIRSAMPLGSRIIDLGCNDGTISTMLLRSGHAASVIGIDFTDIRERKRTDFQFIEADLRNFDLSTLPSVDVVLCLNVLHHMCIGGADFARNFMRQLAGKADLVLCDMGSMTEQGRHLWLMRMQATWKNDEQCWDDLFSPFAVREPLLHYSFQDGQRTLWKLAGNRRLESNSTATPISDAA
jgi:2-polyprenyl-3-methyl-5-hydroxy-6-metoxy-1,4-benzoquinol methylase